MIEDSSITDSDGNELGKLFIGGLSQATHDDSLRDYFARFGEVDDAVVMMDFRTGRSRGFGYVKFSDPDTIDEVLEQKPHQLDNKIIDVKRCNVNMKGRNRRSMKIFVGGIAPEQNADMIKNFFNQYGNVVYVNLMMDQNKRRHRGFAFVGFDEEDVVKRLIQMHYVNINGKSVEIKAMEPPNYPRRSESTTPTTSPFSQSKVAQTYVIKQPGVQPFWSTMYSPYDASTTYCAPATTQWTTTPGQAAPAAYPSPWCQWAQPPATAAPLQFTTATAGPDGSWYTWPGQAPPPPPQASNWATTATAAPPQPQFMPMTSWTQQLQPMAATMPRPPPTPVYAATSAPQQATAVPGQPGQVSNNGYWDPSVQHQKAGVSVGVTSANGAQNSVVNSAPPVMQMEPPESEIHNARDMSVSPPGFRGATDTSTAGGQSCEATCQMWPYTNKDLKVMCLHGEGSESYNSVAAGDYGFTGGQGLANSTFKRYRSQCSQD